LMFFEDSADAVRPTTTRFKIRFDFHKLELRHSPPKIKQVGPIL